jgi:hypothetical protein
MKTAFLFVKTANHIGDDRRMRHAAPESWSSERHRHSSATDSSQRRSGFTTLDRWLPREGGLVFGHRQPTGRHSRTERRREEMSAQTQYFEVDGLGAFPAFVLLLFLVLSALGVVAHAAFA